MEETSKLKKINNPHLKANIKINQETTEKLKEVNEKKINIDNVYNDKQGKMESKTTYAKELLEKGNVDSYIDYFYIANAKTPDIKSKYEKEFNIDSKHSKKIESNYFGLDFLKYLKESLERAEDLLRKGIASTSIEIYLEIRDKTYLSDKIGCIYFNEKAISLSNKYKLTKQLIRSFISMGTLFSNLDQEDFLLSLSFKEEAKKLFKNLGETDDGLETEILESLESLYLELVKLNESQENVQNTMDYLTKQLENLESLIELGRKLEKVEKTKEYLDKLYNVFLKIAELNFKTGKYDNTLDYLQNLNMKIDHFPTENSSTYRIKGYYLYGQTKEELGQYREAIECLSNIHNQHFETKTTEIENYLTKANLNLGRLFYKVGNLSESVVHLDKFFKKARNSESKEMLDVARVNFGMVKANQLMESHIKKITSTGYKDFLGMKLKYFNDQS